MHDSYREHLLTLGEQNHLVATLTLPLDCAVRALAGRGAGDACPGVLFLNAGVIHRIGPHRSHVKLARHLAQAGIPSLRLDLSGLGDSGRAAGTMSMLAQVGADIRAALDLLASRAGVSQFVIMGICSGAEYAYLYAATDSRVSGLVMIDGPSFATWKTKWLRYWLRFATLRWPVLKKALAGRLQSLFSVVQGKPKVTPIDYGLPPLGAREFADGLLERLRRGCQIYLIYTGSILQYYNYASQFWDVMGGLGLDRQQRKALAAVRCEFLPEIDHTLTTLDGQRLVIERVCAWLARLRRS